MIITKRIERFINVEMTETQAGHLQYLLNTGVDGHVNELSIAASQGQNFADDVNETIRNLREALEAV